MYLYIYLYIYLVLDIYIYIYIYVYFFLFLYLYLYLYLCFIYIYIYIYIYTSICIYVYFYLYICVCLCVCVWVYVCTFYTHKYIYIYTLYTQHSLSSETVHPQHFFSIGKTHGHGQAALCPPPVQPTAPAPRRSTSAQGARGWAPARAPEAGRGRGDRCPRRCLKGGSLREVDELGSWDLLLVKLLYINDKITVYLHKMVGYPFVAPTASP